MKKSSLVRTICTCMVVCVFAGMAMASSSSSKKTNNTTENDGENKAITEVVDNRETTVADTVTESDFDIKEYIYESTLGTMGNTYGFLVIKNNSSKAVGVNINMTAFNVEDNVIGADSESIKVIGPGEETLAYCWFENVTGVDHVSYTLSFNETPSYSPVLNDLDVVQTINENNVIVTVTNNGDKAALYPEAHALFFDSDGKVVNYRSTYIMDGNSEIKPGSTISEDIESYEDFDTVVVYLTGRG